MTSERVSKTAYKYTLHNLNQSGTYLRSAPASYMLSQIPIITKLNSSSIEVFVVTMITMVLEFYDALKATLTHIKIRNWLHFQGKRFCLMCIICCQCGEVG